MKKKLDKISFQNKVQAMSAREIIMAMVRGLEKPTTKIEMNSFGHIDENFYGFKICYGCAATNTVCEIGGYGKKDLIENQGRIYFLNDKNFLIRFENAINDLRRGDVAGYNSQANYASFSEIKEVPGLLLPHLNNNYTKKDLEIYKKLADAQEPWSRA